ncbi:MAG: hypothetical protein ACK5OX_06015 [Desertimonas sp.]
MTEPPAESADNPTIRMYHLDRTWEWVTIDAVPALVAELDQTDPENPDVSLEDIDGWALSVASSGVAVWENTEQDHETGRMVLTRDQQTQLLIDFVRGGRAAVDAWPWEDPNV